ncbi:lachesin-like [Bradysia coprophila]|uniref:lachesin-like n=1 Tax=Bradysia coprophila TaxID=38358 RepID=UPI00187DD338|nr:lachesin-like [Bradysia coprophila]
MKYLISLFVIVQICLIHGQDEPTIVKISRNQEKNLGDSIELKCQVANTDDYPVMWLKDRGSKRSPQIISTDTTLAVQEDRYNLNVDKGKTTFSLRIDDLQKRDAGLYRCEIQLSDSNVISAEVTVKLSSDGSAFQ